MDAEVMISLNNEGDCVNRRWRRELWLQESSSLKSLKAGST